MKIKKLELKQLNQIFLLIPAIPFLIIGFYLVDLGFDPFTIIGIYLIILLFQILLVHYHEKNLFKYFRNHICFNCNLEINGINHEFNNLIENKSKIKAINQEFKYYFCKLEFIVKINKIAYKNIILKIKHSWNNSFRSVSKDVQYHGYILKHPNVIIANFKYTGFHNEFECPIIQVN